MSELAERLKREIDLPAHLAASGVTLKGKMARCPFHDDANASMSVSRQGDTWLWHCFGCDAGGSIIDFEMRQHGMQSGDAMAQLAVQYAMTDESVRHTEIEAKTELTVPAPIEIFKDAIAQIYRTSRKSLLQGDAPAAPKFLAAKGIPYEAAVKAGLGATRLTKTKYRKLRDWCISCYGHEAKAIGLGGLFAYAKHGLTVLVYPYWPDYSPPDPSCTPERLPPIKYIKFRPCVARAKAAGYQIPGYFRPKGHECSDPWCPVGLPEHGRTLWLVEGETDALTVIGRGEIAAAMSGATAKLPKRFLQTLRDQEILVRLVADADMAGKQMLLERTRELMRAGVRVEPLRLPEEVGGRRDWGKDLNDLLLALPESDKDRWQEHLVAQPQESIVQAPPENGEAATDSSLVSVVTNDTQLRDIISISWMALEHANNPPQLFRQGEGLAYLGVDPDDMEKPDAERKSAILSVTETVMNGMLLRNIDWLRKIDKGYLKPARPPTDVPRDMVGFRPLPKWLPPIDYVTSTPSYGPDLELIRPGYHSSLRLAYMPSVEITPPVNPSEDALSEAISKIDRLLVDFPFQAQADRVNQIGVMLMSLLRPAIRGNTPLVAVVATIQRSGKGALCGITEGLMTGSTACVAQYSPDPEEFRKALLPYISRGQPIVRLDNVDDGTQLNSPHLASAITEGWYADRVLGHSEIRDVPVRSVFLTTGNRITVSRDLLFRTLWIRLAPQTDRPDRRSFAIDEIEAHVRENRAEYLTALATMVEHWKATGAKPWLGRRWNSFNPFVQTIGGVLEACGIEGFLDNADEQRDEGSPGEAEWRRVLECWSDATQDFQPANWLLEKVFDPCEPLAHINIRGKDDTGRARSLSRLLGREVGRPMSIEDGQVVRIEKDRDPHGKVDVFGLVSTCKPVCGDNSYHNGYPRNIPARIRAPLGCSGDSGYSGDNFDPQAQEKPWCQCQVALEPENEYRGQSELSPLSPLSPLDHVNSTVEPRGKCGDNLAGQTIPADSDGPASPEPPAPLAGMRSEADAAPASAPAGSLPAQPEQPVESAAASTSNSAELPPNPQDWPEDLRVEFEERAAILEYDGGQDRETAEREAKAEIMRTSRAPRNGEPQTKGDEACRETGR